MDLSKYNGNIHPDEWINDVQRCLRFKNSNSTSSDHLEVAITLIDTNILLPIGIDSLDKLRNALKEDISFIVFKNTNKRKLQSLKYIPENKGGDTSKFISNFLKLCYNAEINDIEEKKDYLYNSLPMNSYFSNEFHKKTKNVNSVNELIKEFEEIVFEESILITNESIIALKHVATGKYLSSVENIYYTTGSRRQLVFAGNPVPDHNSLWKIKFDKELATYINNSVKFQHTKSNNKFLGIYYDNYQTYDYFKSPSTDHTEVGCYFVNSSYWSDDWKFKYSKSENHQGHDIQFTIGNDTFQEVICHNERLGGNDEWRIELIKQYV
ncbi:hypothetical protein RclHR1_19740001 [Rhizophagus clarus]|uniref:MIR domain-containing protein n=1 Tax=Rhizophagus clarus TaxID=94130 RepID=A0A2Z6R2B8_9GLOM|nr:hypothetical protein RclHR1_19740001 [Rhizophagus clarus]